MALCIYRVTQEALQNVANHGEANEVRPERFGDWLHLTIADRSIGFHADQVCGSQGLGLVNIKERVRQVKGTFHLDSEPKRGTTVRVEIPIGPASQGVESNIRA